MGASKPLNGIAPQRLPVVLKNGVGGAGTKFLGSAVEECHLRAPHSLTVKKHSLGEPRRHM